MTTYQIIDTICDSINPILALISVALIIYYVARKAYKTAAICLVFFIICALLVYGIMMIDNRLHLWPAFHADYSTHSAVCIALCIAIYLYTRTWIPQLLVVLVYGVLMLVQQYHTILDMLSTALVIGVPLVLLSHFLRKHITTH